jgi:AcrR family transcriptional regulator
MQWLRAPVQQRSQKSLQRILDAAEQILEKKSFSEMSVSEVAGRARSSVGVFYARFGDKLTLLHLLDDRFTAEAEETIEKQLDVVAWKGCTLSDVSAEIIGLLCRIHRRKKGMLRSIILQVREHPDPHFQRNGKRLSRLIVRLAGFLAIWQGEMDLPRPEQGIRLALVMIMATIRETIVFPETTMWPSVHGLGEKGFQAALTESFLRLCGRGKL